MKNNYIFLELNRYNEIRADVNMTIKSLGITAIENINIKIDTGCPYTSIPILKLGISSMKAQQMKQKDCADSRIKKEISFGVNDSKDKREADKEKFKKGQYMELKSITFQHGGFDIDFEGVHIGKDFVKISYDRTGNILIGMDVLSKLDIHIGKSKVLGKTVFLACPNDRINQEYLNALNQHFELKDLNI